MAKVLLADSECLQLAAELGLTGFELAAEALLALRDADALGLELLGDVLLAVTGFGFRLSQLLLQLLDSRP